LKTLQIQASDKILVPKKGTSVKRCSHRVLEIAEDAAGIQVIVKYPDRCTACGDCIGKCKFNALKLIERVEQNIKSGF
jgi:NAD-dependent dihydropyrimidine dehydrogenase PreA subunit